MAIRQLTLLNSPCHNFPFTIWLENTQTVRLTRQKKICVCGCHCSLCAIIPPMISYDVIFCQNGVFHLFFKFLRKNQERVLLLIFAVLNIFRQSCSKIDDGKYKNVSNYPSRGGHIQSILTKFEIYTQYI